MGVDGIGSPGIDKTLKSLRDALVILEREAEYALRFAGQGSTRALYDLARRLVGSLSGDTLVLVMRSLQSMTAEAGNLGRAAASPIGNIAALARLMSASGSRSQQDSSKDGSSRADSSKAKSSGESSGLDLTGILESLTRLVDPTSVVRAVARFVGVVDSESLAALRNEVLAVMDELGRHRERELRVSGTISQMKTRSSGFDEALAGLARLQGRVVARIDEHERRAEEVERMAGRRDDHITRLIRDTAAQRSQLERLAARLEASEKSSEAWEKRLQIVEIESDGSGPLKGLERQVDDLKRLQKSGIQSAIESLEKIRDRVGRLEARATEMSREARAKTGRLDALTRHVATVESKLASAIGKGGDGVVTVAARKIEDFEKSDSTSRHAGSP